MIRRRPKLTPQEKADLKWERMASQPKTMGMVGIFNDLNPGAKHAEAQITHERETFADQDAEGAGPGATEVPHTVVDPRSPAAVTSATHSVTVTPRRRQPERP